MRQFRAAVANGAWFVSQAGNAAAFSRAIRKPARVQEGILRDYLRKNAETEFGRANGFERIGSPEEYAKRVPVSTYDDYTKYIERIAAGEGGVLTSEAVRYFAVSSGSAGAAKWIPYTETLLREFRNAIGPWVASLFAEHPGVMAGPAYWSVTPVGMNPSRRSSVVPVGFEEDAAYVGAWAKKLVEAVQAVPAEIRHVNDMEAFSYLTLLCLLRERELRLVSVWHPSFWTLLLGGLERNWERLLADVRDGGCRPPVEADAELLRKFTKRADRRRAEELNKAGPHGYSKLWPKLTMISCWGDANARLGAEELRRLFPGVVIQGKGLISTESFTSLPWGCAKGCVLAVRSHYVELMGEDGMVVPCTRAENGGVYTIVVTTGGGFYRYHTYDQVRVISRCGETPCVEFIGKTDQVCDLFGEKLNAAFVGDVLAKLRAKFAMESTFGMLAPEERGYVLFLDCREPLPADAADHLDELLSLNPHYAYCRRLGQLVAARVVLVSGEAERIYMETYRLKGQRLGNIKPAVLSTERIWVERMREAMI